MARFANLISICALVAATAGTDGNAAEPTAAPAELSAAQRYTKLMEGAEKGTPGCMIATTFREETHAALQAFGKDVKFLELDPAKPIRIELPEGFYNPQGRTVTFDQFELAIDAKAPSKPYISMTRTAEGLKLEPKLAIAMKDGTMICVRDLSATVKYDSVPTTVTEKTTPKPR